MPFKGIITLKHVLIKLRFNFVPQRKKKFHPAVVEQTLEKSLLDIYLLYMVEN